MFTSQLFFHLSKSILYKFFNYRLVSDLAFEFLKNLSLCVGNDPLHHFILLFHFPVF